MSRVIVDIIERHADEASFLWERRERACRSPAFNLEALGLIDRRLEANLEGLVIAADVGLEVSLAVLARGGKADALFVAMFVAAELGDTRELARLLIVAEQHADGDRVVAAVLGSLSQARADRIRGELLAEECTPSLHRFGLAGHAVRREDPGKNLERALRSTDGALRARAFRAVGQLGRRDLLPELRGEIHFGGDDAEPWALCSAVLLGEDRAAPFLWPLAEKGGRMALVAADLAARCGTASDVAAHIQALAAASGGVHAALAATAARGDPIHVPFVLDTLEARPELARFAAWVYSTITGARLEPPLAVRVPTPAPSESLVARLVADPYEDLPAPDVVALRQHWQQTRSSLAAGQRYLGGRLIEPAWLLECLRVGAQPWRASAAVELLRAETHRKLFPVHAFAHIQARALAMPDDAYWS